MIQVSVIVYMMDVVLFRSAHFDYDFTYEYGLKIGLPQYIHIQVPPCVHCMRTPNMCTKPAHANSVIGVILLTYDDIMRGDL